MAMDEERTWTRVSPIWTSCSDRGPHVLLPLILNPALSTFILFLRYIATVSSPHTMTTSWVCVECGKVCKSRGGLVQHSSIHKRHPRIGELHNDSHRVYHPRLDGTFNLLLRFVHPDALKENPVTLMESFFLPEPHQLPQPQSRLKIGLLSSRVLDSNLQKSCIRRQPSQRKTSTGSSTSGMPRLSPTMTPPQYSTTMTCTQRSTQSRLGVYPGSRILLSTMAPSQMAHQHQSG